MPLARFDDRDPSVKISESGWAILNDPTQFDGTVTHSRVPGSSLTIEFTGISISVFGTINANTTPTSMYAIDNGTPLKLTLGANPKLQLSHEFFESDQLIFGKHTLLVTNNGDWFFFDYFIVKTPDSPTTSQPPTNTPSTNPPPTSPPPTNPPPTSPPITNPPTISPPPPNSPPPHLPPAIDPSSTITHSTQITTFLSLNQTILSSQAETIPQVTQQFSSSLTTLPVTVDPTILSSSVVFPTNAHATVTRVSHLSAGVMAGVVIGVVTAAATILVLLYYFYHKRKVRNITSGSNGFRRRFFFTSRPEPQLAPFDRQQAVRPHPRSRKNRTHSIEYVIPIETRQQQASGPFNNSLLEAPRNIINPNSDNHREAIQGEPYSRPPAYNQLGDTGIAIAL